LTAIPGCSLSSKAKEARYLKRAEALLAKKDYARALLELRNAVSAAPKDAEPYYRMGMVCLGPRQMILARSIH